MKKDITIRLENIDKNFLIPIKRKDSTIEHIKHFFQRNYKYDWKKEILKNISLDIHQGEFIGIIGDNGCGKSTLLKIIAGIFQPNKGKVTIQGSIVPFLELGVGFHPELTAKENVFLNGIILGLDKKYLQNKFDEIIAFAELEQYINLPLKNFSSGMVVRLAFSIAFLVDADIYLLDEVLAVGDIQFQKKCGKVLNNLRNEKKTVCLVSHSLDFVQSFCDKVVWIENGLIKEQGKPAIVIAKYKKSKTKQNV